MKLRILILTLILGACTSLKTIQVDGDMLDELTNYIIDDIGDNSFYTLVHSNNTVKNNLSFCFCDYVEKNYIIDEKCGSMIAKGNKFIQYVQDSIKQAEKIYNLQGTKIEFNNLSKKYNIDKFEIDSIYTEYILSSSELYENRLNVEVSTCYYSPKENEKYCGGTIRVYCFRFDKNMKIEEVYKGNKYR